MAVRVPQLQQITPSGPQPKNDRINLKFNNNVDTILGTTADLGKVASAGENLYFVNCR